MRRFLARFSEPRRLRRALLLNARPYKSVAAILKNGTDRTAPPAEEAPILFLANIRGRTYYI